MENTRLNRIPKNEAEKVMKILKKFTDVFYLPGDQLPSLKGLTHKINLDTAVPIFTKQVSTSTSRRDQETNKRNVTKGYNWGIL